MLPPLLEKGDYFLRRVIGNTGFDRIGFLLKEMSISQARDSLLAALSKSGADMADFLENLKSKKTSSLTRFEHLERLVRKRFVGFGGALGHHVGQIRQEAIDAIGERYIPDLQRPLSRF